MDKEVAMIISTMIRNIEKSEDTLKQAKRTIKAIEVLKETWAENSEVDKKQFDSIIEALKIIYNTDELEKEDIKKATY